MKQNTFLCTLCCIRKLSIELNMQDAVKSCWSSQTIPSGFWETCTFKCDFFTTFVFLHIHVITKGLLHPHDFRKGVITSPRNRGGGICTYFYFSLSVSLCVCVPLWTKSWSNRYSDFDMVFATAYCNSSNTIEIGDL